MQDVTKEQPETRRHRRARFREAYRVSCSSPPPLRPKAPELLERPARGIRRTFTEGWEDGQGDFRHIVTRAMRRGREPWQIVEYGTRYVANKARGKGPADYRKS